MIQTITINKVDYRISKDPKDFFTDNPISQRKCFVAIDMMEDCLDYIYNLMKPHYPNVFKPELFISDSNLVNAFAVKGKSIVICSGLIFQHANLIEQKYTPQLLKKYNVFQGIPHEYVLSGLRVYFWRYVILHELYHIWNKHSLWKKIYEFNEAGKIVQRIQIPTGMDLTKFFLQTLENSFETEHVLTNSKSTNNIEIQKKLTQQAIELDADSSAICMIINMLMRDLSARGISEDDKTTYIRNEIGFNLHRCFCAFSVYAV